jgi:hypothetical protein
MALDLDSLYCYRGFFISGFQTEAINGRHRSVFRRH